MLFMVYPLMGLAVIVSFTSGQNNGYGSSGRSNNNNNNNNGYNIYNNNGGYNSNNNNDAYNIYNVVRNQPLKNKLLYIVLDGFRYNYATDQSSSALQGLAKIAQKGVKAEWLSPIFPSESAPTLTTLVTGLWAESHGIVGNYIYDSQTKQTINMLDPSASNRKWWPAEPIWTTATKKGLKTAVYRYPRCDISYDNVTPDICEPYDSITGQQVFQSTIDKAINSLQNGHDFVIVYEDHVGDIGRTKGTESEGRREAVRSIDQTLSKMMGSLERLQMTDQVNVVIVSDHGMTDVSPGKIRRVQLDDYLLNHYVEAIVEYGAYSNIKVNQGQINQVYDRMRGMPGVQIYKHDQIPNSLHYNNNKFVYDILLKADSNTYITPSNFSKQIPRKKDASDAILGASGYDPNDTNMRGIFYAIGPDFKTNQKLSGIKSVDVYPLLARLLYLQPLPNNGSFSSVQSALLYPIPTTPAPGYGYNSYNAAHSVPIMGAAMLISLQLGSIVLSTVTFNYLSLGT